MNNSVLKINQYLNAETVVSPHLLAIDILKKYNGNELILCLDTEGWDIVENGTEEIVKEICDQLSIPYDKIIFRTSNLNQNLKYFKSIEFPFLIDFSLMKFDENIEVLLPKKYGLFLGRPSNERLYTFYKHLNWNFKDQGIATFHFDVNNINEYKSEFVNFLIDHNEKWKYLKDCLPYSDFDNFLQYPIIDKSHVDLDFWTNIYKKISIEIVCETNVHNQSFFITEKTIRPILYKKLFVVVGSKHYEKQLKELGFDIFDDLIDKSYDNKSYYDRIEHLYGSLSHILKTIKVSDKLIERLEKNQALAIDMIKKEKIKQDRYIKKIKGIGAFNE